MSFRGAGTFVAQTWSNTCFVSSKVMCISTAVLCNIAGDSLHDADAQRPLLGTAADPLHPASLTLLAGLKPSSPISKLQRAVWLDLLREEDARQMDALVAKLDAMRVQKAPEAKVSKPTKREQAGKSLPFPNLM